MAVGGIEGPCNAVLRLIGNGCACGIENNLCLLKRSIVSTECYSVPFFLAALKVDRFKVAAESRSTNAFNAFRNSNACETFAAGES